MTAQAQPASEPTATFSLERFVWDSPDRLEVSGWFDGVGDATSEPPVLVVHASEATLRLPAVSDRLSGPPRDGRRWWAAFAWEDAPSAFEHSSLELGDLVIELPQPRPRRARRGEQVLEVRRDEPRRPPDSGGASDRLALQAALVLAQEEIRSLRGSIEQTQRELQRARADFEAERSRRATDSERFRDGLDRLRSSAEEALAVERDTARDLGRELADARRDLSDQGARLVELERGARESERRRSEIEAVCKETENVLARLTALRDGALNGEPS